MSCCSKGYCTFKFPDGPPLLDNSVQSLNAPYQFLPYGSLLSEGEIVRIWMESGQTKTVIIEQKIPVVYDAGKPMLSLEGALQDQPKGCSTPFSWQLVAFDSGFSLEDIESWPRHELYNPGSPPMLMVYGHPLEDKPTLKERWLRFLYKMRNLGSS